MNKLPNKFIEKLKQMKETGMGYQKVKLILANKEEKIVTVLNCSLIDENINLENIVDIQELEE